MWTKVLARGQRVIDMIPMSDRGALCTQCAAWLPHKQTSIFYSVLTSTDQHSILSLILIALYAITKMRIQS